MNIFYGIYLRDNNLTAALNLIRYLGQPDYIRFSHITLRGPYATKLNKNWLARRKNYRTYKWEVRLEGPGEFSNTNQNTVLIAVDLLDLRDLFYKRDFRDGLPHLTLYDGDDPLFAKSLLQMLNRYDFHNNVPVTEMMSLHKKVPATETFEALGLIFKNAYIKYMGENIGLEEVRFLSSDFRLNMIEGILDDNFDRWSDNLRKQKTLECDQNLSFDF